MNRATSGRPLAVPRPLALGFAQRGLHRYTLLAWLLIAFVGLVTLVAPTDPDVWWHLRNGQLALESGIPRHDVYSFTAAGREWLMQEWLTEVVMYGVEGGLGYGALSLLFGLLQAAGAAIVYTLVRRMGAGRILALGLLMLYLVFAAPTWGVRPQVLTPLFLGSFFLALLAYRRDPSRTRLLWLLPPATALWTNLHASYFIGIALVGAFLVGELANNFLYRPARPTPLRPLALALAGCLLATLLNPYFVELWAYPLTYVVNGTANPLLRYTQEWQSPNFHEPGNLLFAASLVLLALVGIARPVQPAEREGWRLGLRRRVDITEAIVLGAFALLALQAVRLVPLYGLVGLPLLARGLADTWPALSGHDEAPAPALEGKLNWAMGAVGVALTAFVLAGLPQAQSRDEPRVDTAYKYPEEGASYLATLPESARIYNEFAWGGYLIYRLYPRQRVFIDGRADMYRVGIFDDFVAVQNLAPGWRDLLERYGVDTVIIIPGSALDDALAHEAGWESAFRNDVAVVYRR